MDPAILAIEARSCRHIWQSVLVQAARDLLVLKARTETTSGPAAADQHYTRMWIGSRDFREVCELAGFDPGRVEIAFRRRLLAREAGQKLFAKGNCGPGDILPLEACA